MALLRLAAQRGTPFHAVLLDANMPGQGGAETAAQIRHEAAALGRPAIDALLLRRRGAGGAAARAGGRHPAQARPARAADGGAAARALPARRSAAPLPVPEPTPVPQGPGQRILLVEDNATNQILMRALLGRIGAEVTVANNGQEAVNHAKAAPFDVILMDLQMPVMDGLEATR